MKKIAILFLCLFIALSAFAGCGKSNDNGTTVQPESERSIIEGDNNSDSTDGDKGSATTDGDSGSSATEGTSGSGKTPVQPITNGGTAIPH